LLAIDSSEYSAQAVTEVAMRPWPPDTVVCVLSAVESITPPAAELWYDAGGSLEQVQQEMTIIVGSHGYTGNEVAAAALDVWAQDHGYTKIELNLVGV
jgi:hypothetical protein